jgi:uracil-DNA glycosylase
LEELETAVRAFDGCVIKKTASKTVFADGNPKAKIVIIGEAPGAQEDMQGIPFCGPSGQLLDRMLASIGLDRTKVYISNTVFWRPPGNRQPSMEETAICLPFVEKHIALVNPALLILSGGTATTTLLQRDQSISRLRGKFYEYSNPYLEKPLATAVTYHPSYLLRSPGQKRLAWNDLLMIKNFLEENKISI